LERIFRANLGHYAIAKDDFSGQFFLKTISRRIYKTIFKRQIKTKFGDG